MNKNIKNISKEITVYTPGVIMAFTFEFFLPIVLSFLWIKYHNGKIKYILIGIAGFILSVACESIFILIIQLFIDKNTNIFYLIAGICPGLFEESGKYLLIKYIFLKEKHKSISVSYGIGHGGIESILIGFSLLAYLFLKETLIQKGGLKENITLFICIMSASERLSAILIQISLSVIIFRAIKEKKLRYYFLGIILHDLIDLLPLFKLKGIINSILLIELIVGIFSLCLSLYSYYLYNTFEEKSDDKEIPLNDKKSL